MLFLEVKMKKHKKKKWELYLYYNGVLIKKIKIDENEAPAQNSYAIRVFFKKKLFGNLIAGVVVRPIRLLKNDEKSRKTYWGTTLETGLEV
ncbi:MAG: hypothetical protein U0K80_02040 [Methanobrevibacter sp.]|nr:hypothetical protein [Methanobrevibacter sp.]